MMLSFSSEDEKKKMSPRRETEASPSDLNLILIQSGSLMFFFHQFYVSFSLRQAEVVSTEPSNLKDSSDAASVSSTEALINDDAAMSAWLQVHIVHQIQASNSVICNVSLNLASETGIRSNFA